MSQFQFPKRKWRAWIPVLGILVKDQTLEDNPHQWSRWMSFQGKCLVVFAGLIFVFILVYLYYFRHYFFHLQID